MTLYHWCDKIQRKCVKSSMHTPVFLLMTGVLLGSDKLKMLDIIAFIPLRRIKVAMCNHQVDSSV